MKTLQQGINRTRISWEEGQAKMYRNAKLSVHDADEIEVERLLFRNDCSTPRQTDSMMSIYRQESLKSCSTGI